MHKYISVRAEITFARTTIIYLVYNKYIHILTYIKTSRKVHMLTISIIKQNSTNYLTKIYKEYKTKKLNSYEL